MPLLLLSFVAAFGVSGSAAGAGEEQPPNVLLLVADDLGVDQLACYGEGTDLPPTPHLDALAAQGVLFRNAWSYPACSPTRAALQTGRYGFRTGVGSSVFDSGGAFNGPLPLAEITLPEMLDRGQSGYLHAAVGKWHLGTASVGGDLAPNVAGYRHYFGARSNLNPPDSYVSFTKVVDGVASKVDRYATTDEVDDALALMQAAPEPWFLHLAFHLPHEPFHAPPAHLHTQDLSGAGPPQQNPRPYYKAMVEALDTEIGRLLAGLGPLAERTVVVFLADNSTPPQVIAPPALPGHAKLSLFEGGVNVPWIVAGPPVEQPGSECAALVDTTDVFATLAELAGVDLSDPVVIPASVRLDSVSLVPYLADPGAPSIRTHVLAEYFVPNGAGVPPGGVLVTHKPGEPPICQDDLGFGGSAGGHPALLICGDGFTAGGSTMLAVGASAPLQDVVVVMGLGVSPVALFGGTFVPSTLVVVTLLKTDASGVALLPLNGDLVAKLPSFDLFVQAAVRDSAPLGWRLSNAVRLRALAQDHKAIFDGRYKLIAFGNGGPAALYDLALDPLEANDLLQGGLGALTPQQAAALSSLEAALTQLLQS